MRKKIFRIGFLVSIILLLSFHLRNVDGAEPERKNQKSRDRVSHLRLHHGRKRVPGLSEHFADDGSDLAFFVYSQHAVSFDDGLSRFHLYPQRIFYPRQKTVAVLCAHSRRLHGSRVAFKSDQRLQYDDAEGTVQYADRIRIRYLQCRAVRLYDPRDTRLLFRSVRHQFSHLSDHQKNKSGSD